MIPILQADVWVPLMMQPEFKPGYNWLEARGNNFMQVVARLRPGVTPELAQEGLDGLTLGFREEMPEGNQCASQHHGRGGGDGQLHRGGGYPV